MLWPFHEQAQITNEREIIFPYLKIHYLFEREPRATTILHEKHVNKKFSRGLPVIAFVKRLEPIQRIKSGQVISIYTFSTQMTNLQAFEKRLGDIKEHRNIYYP